MSPDDNDHPPSRITANIPTATSSLANDDDDPNPDPQCHITTDRTRKGATEEEWEGIEAGG